MKTIWWRAQKKGSRLAPSPKNFFYCTDDAEYIYYFVGEEESRDTEVVCFTVDDRVNVFDLFEDVDELVDRFGYPKLVKRFFLADTLPTVLTEFAPDLANIAGKGVNAENARNAYAKWLKSECRSVEAELDAMDTELEASGKDYLDLIEWCRKISKKKNPTEAVIKDVVRIDKTYAGILDVQHALIVFDVNALGYMASGIEPLEFDEFLELFELNPGLYQDNSFASVSNAISKMRKNGISA